MENQQRLPAQASAKLAFSLDEVATLLGLCRATVKHLTYTGRLRSVNVGRRRLIPRAALLELLGDGMPNGDESQE